MNKVEFKEQYKNRGLENYTNKKKNKCSKVEKFSINCLNYKFYEYTIKNKDYDPRRTFVRSRLKNNKNWDEFQMPYLSHHKYIHLNQLCPCCSHGIQTHKLI